MIDLIHICVLQHAANVPATVCCMRKEPTCYLALLGAIQYRDKHTINTLLHHLLIMYCNCRHQNAHRDERQAARQLLAQARTKKPGNTL